MTLLRLILSFYFVFVQVVVSHGTTLRSCNSRVLHAQHSSMSSSGGHVQIKFELRNDPPPYSHGAIPSAIYENAKRPSHIDHIENTLRIAVARIQGQSEPPLILLPFPAEEIAHPPDCGNHFSRPMGVQFPSYVQCPLCPS